MPPKAKFTKEEVVAAAMEIVESDGADALTARSLGQKLGSSARPIFTVFSGMGEVFEEVVSAAKAIYGEYIAKALGQSQPFKAVGTAYIRFAAERPRLFQLLFMRERDESSNKFSVLRGIEEHYEDIVGSIESSYALEKDKAKELYMHLWVYSHGIAVLIATCVCRFTAEQISDMLTEVFVALLKKIKAEGRND